MIKAYSKLNVGLNIDPQRFDFTDKHKIESLFVIYHKLYDELAIYPNQKQKDDVTYYIDNNKINYSDCLVVKTLDYLRQKQLITSHYDVIIKKNIPVQSGLGGASSDAASVIKTLYKDYLKLDMLEIALQLGSDIPFFLSGYEAAIIREFGESIEPVNLIDSSIFDVYMTNIQFSTKQVFEMFDHLNSSKNKNDFYKIISELNNYNKPSNIYNDLLDIVKQISPEWGKIYEQHATNNCITMSGSGGSIVVINTNKLTKVRARYAPSPTGYFHIGGARTAIFNYLFAKHNHGDFIVRIEDTDINRSVDKGIESQLDNLEWLNIIPDESLRNPKEFGPYVQTDKLPRYQLLVQKLLDEGKVYFCFCDEEKLENDRQLALSNHQTPRYSRTCLNYNKAQVDELIASGKPKVVRLKIDDDKEYIWNDLIRGQIIVPGTAMTDPVILKSNGIPMYNFAVVVDDYDMLISHVLRGEEHISNTPYQIAIRDALNFNNGIQYGHLSVIIDETGKKLSKRNKEMKQFIEDYKTMGFLPEAVFNFLGLLSWSSPNNEEILSQEQFIQLFDIARLSKSPTFFDYKKMLWIGNEYFKKMDDASYIQFVKPFVKLDLSDFLLSNFGTLVLLFKNQISYADELNNLISEQFLVESMEINFEAKQILDANQDVIVSLKNELLKIQDWNIDNINLAINNVKNSTNKKGKDLFMPIRIVSTGLMHGPEIAKVLYFVQAKRILNNIDKILK